jgi:hypothetical protein
MCRGGRAEALEILTFGEITAKALTRVGKLGACKNSTPATPAPRQLAFLILHNTVRGLRAPRAHKSSTQLSDSG